MSQAFLELLSFLLVAGLVFFSNHDTPHKYVGIAKLVLASGCAAWIVTESIIKLAGLFGYV